jgi:transcriptional regulator with XRE-family HTH domain
MSNYPTPTSVAEVFTLIRTALKMTQEELARELGKTKQAISYFENGTNEPDRNTMADWYTSTSEVANVVAREIFIARARQAMCLVSQPRLN